MAAEDDSRCGDEDAPADLHRQPGEKCHDLLDDQIGKDRIENVPQCVQLARMVCVAPRRILNSELICKVIRLLVSGVVHPTMDETAFGVKVSQRGFHHLKGE